MILLSHNNISLMNTVCYYYVICKLVLTQTMNFIHILAYEIHISSNYNLKFPFIRNF